MEEKIKQIEEILKGELSIEIFVGKDGSTSYNFIGGIEEAAKEIAALSRPTPVSEEDHETILCGWNEHSELEFVRTFHYESQEELAQKLLKEVQKKYTSWSIGRKDHFYIRDNAGMREDSETSQLKQTIQELQEKNRWVPVSEKLPEPGEVVLVYCRSQGRQLCYRGYSGDKIKWIMHYDTSPAYLNITHWKRCAELPSPPEETTTKK